MKKNKFFLRLSLVICLINVFITSCKNNTVLSNDAEATFVKNTHDFGDLELKKEATIVFEFINTSKEILQIQNVETTCGCAAPIWTKKNIHSKEKGEITVTYDSKYPGRFNKTITVFYNGKNSPQELKVKGRVAYPEDKKK
jgi:hypothetical protein